MLLHSWDLKALEVGGKVLHLTLVVLRDSRQLPLMGHRHVLLVRLQLCDLGLQYYTRKVDGM